MNIAVTASLREYIDKPVSVATGNPSVHTYPLWQMLLVFANKHPSILIMYCHYHLATVVQISVTINDRFCSFVILNKLSGTVACMFFLLAIWFSPTHGIHRHQPGYWYSSQHWSSSYRGPKCRVCLGCSHSSLPKQRLVFVGLRRYFDEENALLLRRQGQYVLCWSEVHWASFVRAIALWEVFE